MRRREIIAGLAGAAALHPSGVLPQQPMPVVGFLADATPEGFAPRLVGVKQGLAAAGFVDGRNVKIEPRWARGDYDLLPKLAAEFVAAKVAVIPKGPYVLPCVG